MKIKKTNKGYTVEFDGPSPFNHDGKVLVYETRPLSEMHNDHLDVDELVRQSARDALRYGRSTLLDTKILRKDAK